MERLDWGIDSEGNGKNMRFKNLPKTLIIKNLKAKAQDRHRVQISKIRIKKKKK